jgi:hypothetical protein
MMMPRESTDPIEERRQKPRLYRPFPIKVQGMDATGSEFEISTVLDNISAGGLYFRLSRNIEMGARLSIIVRLSSSPEDTESGMQVAAHGQVVRVDDLPMDEHGIAVIFKHRRYL